MLVIQEIQYKECCVHHIFIKLINTSRRTLSCWVMLTVVWSWVTLAVICCSWIVPCGFPFRAPGEAQIKTSWRRFSKFKHPIVTGGYAGGCSSCASHCDKKHSVFSLPIRLVSAATRPLLVHSVSSNKSSAISIRLINSLLRHWAARHRWHGKRQQLQSERIPISSARQLNCSGELRR